MRKKKSRDERSVVLPITTTVGMLRYAKAASKKMPDCVWKTRGSASHYFGVAAKRLREEIESAGVIG